MSDEPPDAQKLIAEVVRVHRFTSRRINNPNRPGFLVNVEACKGCDWYGTERNVHDHDAHVAVEVDKALGGLKAEKRILPQWRETGEFHHDRLFEGKPVPRTELHYLDQSRFVSGWTVTE